MSTNKMDTSAVFEMFEMLNKKLDVIHSDNKANENQQTNQSVSKEDIEKIIHEKVSVLATFIELKMKQQFDNLTNAIDKKLSTLSFSGNSSFPQPKKIAFFGF